MPAAEEDRVWPWKLGWGDRGPAATLDVRQPAAVRAEARRAPAAPARCRWVSLAGGKALNRAGWARWAGEALPSSRRDPPTRRCASAGGW